MGIIAIAMLAFVVNPTSLEKLFGAKPGVYGKVNGEEISKEDFDDQLFMLQQQAQQQGQPAKGLEEQAWQMVVQSKLIKQQFEKMGLTLTDDMFWNQLQFDPMFAQNKENFDAKGNFKIQEIKKQVDELQKGGNVEMYNNWLKTKKSIQYRIMARQIFANVSSGITVGKKEAEEMMKQRDLLADIDFVKVDYAAFAQKNPVKVTTQDLADYIKLHPVKYKRDASRNIGLVYFPAAPSAADDTNAQTEINKLFSKGSDVSEGKENFQNTKNDSMFIALNSDLPFNSQYFSAAQLPVSIKDKVASAALGTTFGPYKEQNFYVVSKLLDKKTSDSTLSSHILFAYKGSERSTATRSKEEAKALAEKTLAEIKANPAKFAEDLKLSDEPNAAERGGSVGWTTPASQFAPGYLSFLANNSKGSIGLQETNFGYHIIKVDDKKSGSMTYKVANLVKAIKPSDRTENEIYSKATKFIQQVQGKSFNDFSNIAKKSNYQFLNPKEVGRFQGQLPGLATDKDEEIIAWAFNKKRQKGDTDIFAVDGTGDRIVAFLNGVQDAGTADPEAVRDQIEPIIKNKLIAKQISDKITAAKATGLDQIAKLFATSKQSTQVNLLNPQVAGAMEPKVAGAAFGVAKGKVSNPIEGMTGVYVVVKKSETTNKQPGDIKQITQAIAGQNSQQFGQAFLKSLQDNANIKDYRIEVYNKASQQ
jgi:peptidyl-prolyl cis-trans isomerase D